ncbi:MAG: beta-N-acetylhexosaminidase, partial [Bacteroidota bacterium]|nr:beta-N-acetylhexosaminidase [Bacteroidota bacterium]
VWLNRKLIDPPIWKNPGMVEKTEEIPFSDENYSFRKPTKISLKKGWNTILLKVPQDGTSWKWMFTFVPVRIENEQVKEIKGLKFSVDK